MALATNPDFATEVTLQPLERFPLDAAILFSDILTVPDAMGLGLSFAPAKVRASSGRCATKPTLRSSQCPTWTGCATCSTRSRRSGARLHGRVPLIGFSGSPWTLACYMVEGGGSDDYRRVKTMLYARPDLMHRILDDQRRRGGGLPQRADRRRRAGGDDVRLAGAACWPTRAFQRFSLAYTAARAGAAEARARGPARAAHRVHQGRRAVAGGHCRLRRRRGRHRLDRRPRRMRAGASATRCVARQSRSRRCCSRRRRPSRPRRAATLASFGDASGGHVFNLGHGISQHTPPDHVAALVEAVHTQSRRRQRCRAVTRRGE